MKQNNDPNRALASLSPEALEQLVQLVKQRIEADDGALASHARGHWFKSSTAHHEAGRSILDLLVVEQNRCG